VSASAASCCRFAAAAAAAAPLLLLQEVSRHYPGTTPDHVLSCVPNEGIFITMTALLGPGDTVVVMHPGTRTALNLHS
jgi:histidinol-phosphate/aromatic aminotransferase/cobyric acid decarboxylase-like protein